MLEANPVMDQHLFQEGLKILLIHASETEYYLASLMVRYVETQSLP